MSSTCTCLTWWAHAINWGRPASLGCFALRQTSITVASVDGKLSLHRATSWIETSWPNLAGRSHYLGDVGSHLRRNSANLSRGKNDPCCDFFVGKHSSHQAGEIDHSLCTVESAPPLRACVLGQRGGVGLRVQRSCGLRGSRNKNLTSKESQVRAQVERYREEREVRRRLTNFLLLGWCLLVLLLPESVRGPHALVPFELLRGFSHMFANTSRLLGASAGYPLIIVPSGTTFSVFYCNFAESCCCCRRRWNHFRRCWSRGRSATRLMLSLLGFPPPFLRKGSFFFKKKKRNCGRCPLLPPPSSSAQKAGGFFPCRAQKFAKAWLKPRVGGVLDGVVLFVRKPIFFSLFPQGPTQTREIYTRAQVVEKTKLSLIERDRKEDSLGNPPPKKKKRKKKPFLPFEALLHHACLLSAAARIEPCPTCAAGQTDRLLFASAKVLCAFSHRKERKDWNFLHVRRS